MRLLFNLLVMAGQLEGRWQRHTIQKWLLKRTTLKWIRRQPMRGPQLLEIKGSVKTWNLNRFQIIQKIILTLAQMYKINSISPKYCQAYVQFLHQHSLKWSPDILIIHGPKIYILSQRRAQQKARYLHIRRKNWTFISNQNFQYNPRVVRLALQVR